MNDKCKYCDYVSKCSRKCEYDSVSCIINRSFPKVVDKSYEQLKQENKSLKDNWNKLKKWLNTFHKLSEFEQWEIINKMQELEQGSDSK